MKFPRGVSSERLLKLLKHHGYEVIRQKGSHVRLRHPGPPQHNVTVPIHDQLKTGTLHGILSEVAQMRSVSIDSLAGDL